MPRPIAWLCGLIGLTLTIAACSGGGSTPTAVATPPAPLRPVVFLQGLNTSLSTDEDPRGKEPQNKECNDGTFSCIKRTLTAPGLGYTNADFLEFSYAGGSVAGGEWRPNAYACGVIVAQSLETSVARLHAMLDSYTRAHAPQRVEYTLVGHSYGGLVAFRELENVTRPDAPFRVKTVVTLDSPLRGGILADLSSAIQDSISKNVENRVVRAALQAAVRPLERCFQGPAVDEIAAMAKNRDATVAANKALAQKARGAPYNISIFTLGNADDLLYLKDGPETQAIEGLPNNPSLFHLGSFIEDAKSGKLSSPADIGHSRIYSSPQTVSLVASLVGPKAAAAP